MKYFEVFDYDEPNKSVSVEFDDENWSPRQRMPEDIIIDEADRKFREHYGYVPESYDWEEAKEAEVNYLEAVNA